MNCIKNECIKNIKYKKCTYKKWNYKKWAYKKRMYKKRTYKKKNWSSDTNIRNFNDSLSTQSWESVLNLNDPQLSFTNFSDTFFKLYDTHLPMVSKKFNTNFHKIEPWFTLGLLTSRKKKFPSPKNTFPTLQPCLYLS